MKHSILWALSATISAAALMACTTENQFVLPDDDDSSDDSSDDGGSGGTGGTGGQGGTGGTGGMAPTGEAHAAFVEDLYPTIAADCGSCHGNPSNPYAAPQFMTGNAEGSYTAITSFQPTLIAVPDNSLFILHGAHTGPALTPEQDTLARIWLQLEADERGLVGGEGGPEPTGPTLNEALAGFADCMSLEDWNATGMNTLANSQTQFGSCNGCHTAGEGGAALPLNTEQMFAMNKMFPYIKRLISGTVDENGAFAGLVAANRFINKGLEAESCNQEVDNCHPVYSMPPNKVQAIESFVSLTLEKYENGPCTPQP